MTQAESANITSVSTHSSAGGIRRRSFPSPVPSAVAHGLWWIPIVDHPGRPTYVRFAIFRHKAKPTFAEAVAYASRVIAWRAHFEGFKRRRREATLHPRYLEAAE